jgi:hypothetical protein
MGLDLLGDAALGVSINQAILLANIEVKYHGTFASNYEFARLCIESGLMKAGQILSLTGESPNPADMFEAIFGAVYLDGGQTAVSHAYARVAALYSSYSRQYLSACADSDRVFKWIDVPCVYPKENEPLAITPVMASQLAESHKLGRLAPLGTRLIRLWAIDELIQREKWPKHIDAQHHTESERSLRWQREVAAAINIHGALIEFGYKSAKEAMVSNFRSLIALAYFQGNWTLCKRVLNSAQCLLEPVKTDPGSANVAPQKLEPTPPVVPAVDSPPPGPTLTKRTPHNFVVELEGLLEAVNTFKPRFRTWETRVAGGEAWFRCQLKLGKETFSEGGGIKESAAIQNAAEALVDRILSGENIAFPRHGDGRR